MTIRPALAWFVRLARRASAAGMLLATLAAATPAAAQEPLRIGSKRFTESYLLAQLLTQAAQPHARVELKQGLGNTAIVFEALKSGAIDLYPDYSGTIALELLKNPQPVPLSAMNEQLRPLGLGVAIPFGFQDGYALALREADAGRLGIRRLSDLARHPGLRLGLSHEFIGRADGWPGLAARYGLAQVPRGLDHGLAYEALAAGQVDVVDVYTTDAKLARLGLRVLQDDAGYFPRYDGVVLYRLDVPGRHPRAWAALQGLAGRIDEAAMIAMNARAELDGAAFDVVAREQLARMSGIAAAAAPATRGFGAKLLGTDLPRLAGQHLALVAAAVSLAALLGVPLALAVGNRPRVRALVLAVAGLLQTVPSLALLAVLIWLLGRIGTGPALVALTAYALLPVLQATSTGLQQVPRGLKDAARALGLSPRQCLRLVELPLALPALVSGLRTATSIAVGTATLAAFVGAGGLGERIVTGLALNDHELMLAGALPAAALALLSEALFEAWSRRLHRRAAP